MLTPQRQRGVTLIELVVAVVILGVMMAMAAPSFSNWITGTRIRSTAESMLAGLQYARSEATTRNTQVRFQLTTSLDATCAFSTSSANWLVDVVTTDANDSVETRCNATPSDTVAPTILQVRAAAETGSGIVVAAGSSQVIFNGLGRQVPIAPATAATNVSIDISPATTRGTCVASGGKVTCLRIVVTPGGLVRMCNPAAASSDPQAC